MQLRFECYSLEYLEDFGIGILGGVFGADWHQLSKNFIYVKIIDNKKAIVSADVCYEELTCLISVYLSCDDLTINVIVMSFKAWCFFVGRRKYWWRWWRRRSRWIWYCIFLTISEWDSSSVGIMWTRLNADRSVLILFLIWKFLVDWTLDYCT